MKVSDIIQWLIAIIGAAAWIPWIFDQLKKSKVDASIMTFTCLGSQKWTHGDIGLTVDGLIFIMRIKLTALNKNFRKKKFEIFVKYPEFKDLSKGTLIPPQRLTMPWSDGERELKLDETQLLIHNSIIEKDEILSTYIVFGLDGIHFKEKKEIIGFEYLLFKFYNLKGKVTQLKILHDDIDWTNILVDPEIWVPLNAVQPSISNRNDNPGLVYQYVDR